ncbi:hypothetical protein Mapa_001068 [Marchantia paleacea]|nr:hypothetical protein Mapa_001068 [Marchantia paleacea]
MMTVLFFWAANDTHFFERTFGVRSLHNHAELTAAIYLQVSIISQALIYVTRSVGWCFMERPGSLLMSAFVAAQLGIGWKWAGVIWLYSFISFLPLDIIKFAIRYILSGKAWSLMLERRSAFTSKKDFGKDDRQAQWAHHGLTIADAKKEIENAKDVPELAFEAKRRAEMARLRELHTLTGHVESVVRMKGIDMNAIQQSYTL